MVKPFPSKTHIGNHMLHPETLMLNSATIRNCRKELSNHQSF